MVKEIGMFFYFLFLFFPMHTWLLSVHADSYAKAQRVSVKTLYPGTGYIFPGLKWCRNKTVEPEVIILRSS